MSRDITMLHPQAQAMAARLIDECNKQGLVIKITDCVRNAEEQLDCYNRKTSSLKYPYSMHNWGVAFDFCRNDGTGAYNTDGNFFEKVGAVGQSMGLIWGGAWTKPDRPHFQLSDWGVGTSKLISTYGTPISFMSTWKIKNTYTVAKGDSLSSIARKHGTTYQAIALCNGIQAPYIINIGQVLMIPTDSTVEVVACPYPMPTRTIKYTNPLMTGDDVRFVQWHISADQDGKFGKDSEKALKKWQAAHGLEEDGMFGPACRKLC